MNAKHVLVPLDILHSKTDTLLFLQRLAAESPVCATLLYVVELNVEQPDRALFDHLCAEGQTVLRRLARRFLGHEGAARLRVSCGRPDEEILAQARADRPDLILLSSPKPWSWRHLCRSHTVPRVVQSAPCPTLVLPLVWPGAPGAGQVQPCRQAVSPGLHPTWATAPG